MSTSDALFSHWARIAGNGQDKIARISAAWESAETPQLLPEIEALAVNAAEDIRQRNQAGDHTVWNGGRFRLLHFQEGRDRNERIRLALRFVPSTYSHFVATERWLQSESADKPGMCHRDVLLTQINMRGHDTDVAHAAVESQLSVAIMVVTADGQLIISCRNDWVATAKNMRHCSTHEGMQAETEDPDIDEQGLPSPVKCGLRSLREELGIRTSQDQILWVTFGHDRITWDYDLVGLQIAEDDARSILQSYEARAKDKAEHVLQFIPFDPSAVVKFLLENRDNSHHLLIPACFYALAARFDSDSLIEIWSPLLVGGAIDKASRSSPFWVECQWKGSHEQLPMPLSGGEVEEFLNQRAFTLIVDERDLVEDRRLICIRRSGRLRTIAFGRASPRALGMLWLMLSNSAKGQLHHRQILDHFSVSQSMDDKAKWRAVSFARDELRGLVSDLLIGKMLGKSHKGIYPILAKSWSWCWIRPGFDHDHSALVYDGD